ncbi:MAG: hypothetical protein QW046_04285 [Candidatus Micrarchaeaceae archaeon]
MSRKIRFEEIAPGDYHYHDLVGRFVIGHCKVYLSELLDALNREQLEKLADRIQNYMKSERDFGEVK